MDVFIVVSIGESYSLCGGFVLADICVICEFCFVEFLVEFEKRCRKKTLVWKWFLAVFFVWMRVGAGCFGCSDFFLFVLVIYFVNLFCWFKENFNQNSAF